MTISSLLAPLRAVFVLGIVFVAGANLSLAQEADAADTVQYRNGGAALRLGHLNAAFEIFTRDCAAGRAADCYQLGDMYRRGIATVQDFDAAAETYQRACDLGSSAGCTQLANMLFEGRTLDQDYPRARTLYTEACDLDEPAACGVLGNMMYVGLGGGKDRNRGAELMRQSCRADVEYACGQVRRYGLSNDGSRSGVLDREFWRGN
ncbi:MAG: sel1 repeat family protein [Hyphomonadaceae bacterium]|nr:sel1 repeat family protein [Hyphomonadaceae bacterium]